MPPRIAVSPREGPSPIGIPSPIGMVGVIGALGMPGQTELIDEVTIWPTESGIRPAQSLAPPSAMPIVRPSAPAEPIVPAPLLEDPPQANRQADNPKARKLRDEVIMDSQVNLRQTGYPADCTADA